MRLGIRGFVVLCAPMIGLGASVRGGSPLDIQMALSSNTVLLGEPVWVDLRVTNRSNESLGIDTGNACFGARPITIEVPGAAQGSLEHKFCGQMGGDCAVPFPSVVQPGETITRRYVLTGDFRITRAGAYRVLLQKEVRYARVASATPPMELPKPKKAQIVSSQSALNVLPPDPVKLLAIEHKFAQQATTIESISKPPANPNGQRIDIDRLRRELEIQRKTEYEWYLARLSIAEGLAAYPAAGMEPVFRGWLERAEVSYYALDALHHLNTPAAREVLAKVAGSTAKPDASYQRLRPEAIDDLADMGARAYLPLVEKLTRDGNDDVRLSAIRDLGMLGGAGELRFINRLAHRDINVHERSTAILAMGDTATLKAVPILIALFTLPNAEEPGASDHSLLTITHHSLSTKEYRTARAIRQSWKDWWARHKSTARAYGPFKCYTPIKFSIPSPFS